MQNLTTNKFSLPSLVVSFWLDKQLVSQVLIDFDLLPLKFVKFHIFIRKIFNLKPFIKSFRHFSILSSFSTLICVAHCPANLSDAMTRFKNKNFKIFIFSQSCNLPTGVMHFICLFTQQT